MSDPHFTIAFRGMKTLYQILTAMSTYNFMDVLSKITEKSIITL